MGLRLWSRIAADIDRLQREALKSYIEPSYLITICCIGTPVTGGSLRIAPVAGSLVGLTNT